MKADKTKEKFNFTNHPKTICMLEVVHNSNIFKYQKHQIKNSEL
jgi:hypothetical protein